MERIRIAILGIVLASTLLAGCGGGSGQSNSNSGGGAEEGSDWYAGVDFSPEYISVGGYRVEFGTANVTEGGSEELFSRSDVEIPGLDERKASCQEAGVCKFSVTAVEHYQGCSGECEPVSTRDLFDIVKGESFANVISELESENPGDYYKDATEEGSKFFFRGDAQKVSVEGAKNFQCGFNGGVVELPNEIIITIEFSGTTSRALSGCETYFDSARVTNQ
jgi:hypothetical protein